MKVKVEKVASLLLSFLFAFLTARSVMALAPRSKIINVPYINQCDIVNGCEAVSSTMVLNYYGYNIDKHTFVNNYLVKRDWDVDDQDQIFAPDPNSAYVGDPYIAKGLNCGFGCYANAVVKSINRAIGDGEHKAVVTNAKSLDELASNYISKDILVLVWATINMKESCPGWSWKITYADKNSDYKVGDEFTWIAKEHCLVLVGYDKDNYYFNDPYDNHGLIGYNKELAEQRFQELHRQSVVVIEK